jgi:hypothetical protein
MTINGNNEGITVFAQSASPSDIYFIAESEFLIMINRVKRLTKQRKKPLAEESFAVLFLFLFTLAESFVI